MSPVRNTSKKNSASVKSSASTAGISNGMSKTLVLKPRVSEKSYAQAAENVYVFAVPKSANKLEIAAAVEAQFDVSVTGVNTLVKKGKAKRTIRKGGRPVKGRESDLKKAYVTLKDGDSIALFASEEEQAKPEKSAPEAKEVKTSQKPEATDSQKPRRRFGRRGNK